MASEPPECKQPEDVYAKCPHRQALNKNGNGWGEWSRHVLSELAWLKSRYEDLDTKLNGLVVSHAVLNVKAGIWGALAGLAAAIIPVLFMLMKGKSQ